MANGGLTNTDAGRGNPENEKQLRERVERLEEILKHRDADMHILKTELEIESKRADSLELDRDRVVGDLHLCEDKLTAMIELFVRVAQMLKQEE